MGNLDHLSTCGNRFVVVKRYWVLRGFHRSESAVFHLVFWNVFFLFVLGWCFVFWGLFFFLQSEDIRLFAFHLFSYKGPRLQNCKVETAGLLTGVTCGTQYNLRRLVAAAANPAPIDASDMSFDEYADDLLDVFTHHRMKAEKRSGSIRLRRALQRRPTSSQARFQKILRAGVLQSIFKPFENEWRAEKWH